jgi:hypothetical protein
MDRGTPIDRFYIEAFLRENRRYITGDVLEMGESKYTDLFGQKHRAMKFLYGSQTGGTVVGGDLADLEGLPRGVADCFILTQTLSFIFSCDRALMGVRRVLKPGGVVLATVAGISQVSRYDADRWGDYWRFTRQSVQRLFCRDFCDVRLRVYGNLASATALLQGLAVEDLDEPAILNSADEDYPVIIGAIARAGE